MSMVFITDVETREPGFLQITWDDGVTREVDITDWLTGRALIEMLQIPEVFRDVKIIEGGGGLEWINGVDFCAQALRLYSDAQENSELKVDA